jgi:hypothetical protein
LLNVPCEVLRQLGAIDAHEDIADERSKFGLPADSLEDTNRESCEARVGQPIRHRLDREFAMLGDGVAEIDPIGGICVPSPGEQRIEVRHGRAALGRFRVHQLGHNGDVQRRGKRSTTSCSATRHPRTDPRRLP